MLEDIRKQLHSFLTELEFENANGEWYFKPSYERISSLIKNNIPNKLYRYRRFDAANLNINALVNDQIWLSTPEKMNDVFDGTLLIDKDVILKAYDEYMAFSYEAIKNNPIKDMKMNMGTSENPIIMSLTDAVDKYTEDEKFKRYVDDFYVKFREIILVDDLYNIIKTDYLNLMRNKRRIACFSETINSNRMWGYYADYHTGFALAYDFKKQNLVCPKKHNVCFNSWLNYPIFPIIYEQSALGNFYLMHFIWGTFNKCALKREINSDHFFDWLFSIGPFLYKNEDWEHEKEWRLLSKVEDGDFGQSISPYDYIYYRPCAIYCGYRIDDGNRENLIKIAKEKSIDIYDMKIDPHNNELYPQKIEI